jgi:RNA polymerase sigma factor (sigma-70 family)
MSVMGHAPPTREAPLGDAALVEAARNGDRSAFAALVERHRALALALSGELLGSPHVAADLVQEAAVTALVGLDQLRRPAKFGPWFAGIALNLARRWWRDAKRATVPSGAGDATVDGPEDAALREELAGRVRAAVDRLPAGQRDALLAFYWKGLSHAEAAAELGVSPNAVKARLHQARSRLAPSLEPYVATGEAAAEAGDRAPADHAGRRRTRKEIPMAENARGSGTKEWIAVDIDEVHRSREEARAPGFHAVVLRERSSERRVPIYIGAAEATALAFSLETVETPRPMTYAMMSQLLEAAGAKVTDVRITHLEDRTIFAVVVVDTPSGPREVDARPSDALNLALVTGAPVFVASRAFEALECALQDWQRYPDRARDLVSEAEDRHSKMMAIAEAAERRREPEPAEHPTAPTGR